MPSRVYLYVQLVLAVSPVVQADRLPLAVDFEQQHDRVADDLASVGLELDVHECAEQTIEQARVVSAHAPS